MDYFRLTVQRSDDSFIYGTIAGQPGSEVKVQYSPDFDYLRPLLGKGVKLNIVAPRHEAGGSVSPELIIYEPDYLADVSSVAACFETYGSNPLIHILKRMSPAPAGDAINLGNFAGQFLDEILHEEYDSYVSSALKFFRANALTLAAWPPSASFHSEARSQIANIQRAIDSSPSVFGHDFHRHRVMVEPTFFSEMLGLQGRFDFLQLDYKILAEQKSGRGNWPYDGFMTPTQRFPHYIQLLLYMAILRYNFADKLSDNGGSLHAYLIYSKYHNSVIDTHFSQRYLLEAIKMRNLMVYNDILHSREGFDFLNSMSPEDLNDGSSSGKLWQQYTRPQLAALLDPVRDADPLSRAYFMRMMRFVAREHILAKIGDGGTDCIGFADGWLHSTAEKVDNGNIFTGLKLYHGFTEGEIIETLLLRFSDPDSCYSTNFRIGDIVILYPYTPGEEPDMRRNMVFRCTLASITAEGIELRLRAPQSTPAAFNIHKGCLWAVEHDFLESSYSGLYRSLHSFLCASEHRRDLLLLRREPESDPGTRLNGDYGPFNSLAQRVAAARDLFIIIGPPGTGKTSFGMLTTVQEELTHPGSNILVMAYTNRAVDEICDKLLEAGIDFIRLGNELSCSAASRHKLLKYKVKNLTKATQIAELVKGQRVVVATTTAINSQPAIFRLKSFSLAVIDEASQILEPQLLGILCARSTDRPDATDSIRRFVLIGDHKQLPAISNQSADDAAVTDESLLGIGLRDCRQSLFERLVRRYGRRSDICYMLERQGRMHRDISRFASENFYGGRLVEVPLPHQHAGLPELSGDIPELGRLIGSRRIVFIDIAREGMHPQSAPAVEPSLKVNYAEAKQIARIITEIYRLEETAFDPADTVGVIVPYRNQIAAIRHYLDFDRYPALADISIDTVERYQGSQRRYIVYGFTVSAPSQLDFLTSQSTIDDDGTVIDRKLNVALTRAREHLILIGNARLLRTNAVFARLIDFAEA